jgi:hypothetical protein
MLAGGMFFFQVDRMPLSAAQQRHSSQVDLLQKLVTRFGEFRQAQHYREATKSDYVWCLKLSATLRARRRLPLASYRIRLRANLR